MATASHKIRKQRQQQQEALATTTCTRPLEASWRTPLLRWPWDSLDRASVLDNSTWSRTYVYMSLGQNDRSLANNHTQINKFVNVSALKHYFNVSNAYVLRKLLLVLFPWRHKPWSRQISHNEPGSGSSASFLPPRDDINSPDIYIPVMAFTTYVLLSTMIAGLNGKFKPELLGITFSNASVIIILELVLLWLGRYFLNINSESQIYDLVAYSGYKFVGVIVTIAIAAISNGGKGTGGWVGWTVFGYTFMANAFFLVSLIASFSCSSYFANNV
jgi:hypothetical protein